MIRWGGVSDWVGGLSGWVVDWVGGLGDFWVVAVMMMIMLFMTLPIDTGYSGGVEPFHTGARTLTPPCQPAPAHRHP